MFILAVGGLTRLVALGHHDLWLDEVYSVIASNDLLAKLLQWQTTENQAHSPGSFLAVKLSRFVSGRSEWATRLPEALFSIGAMVVAYLWLWRRLGMAAALGASLLLGLNPFVLQWGREARMYSSWLFFTLLLLAVVESAVRRSLAGPAKQALDWRWWLTGVLMMAVHAFNVHAVFTVTAVFLSLGLIAAGKAIGRQWVQAATLLGGSGISALVFVSSWSLTGLGKMLHYLQAKSFAHDPANEHSINVLGDIRNVLGMLAGDPPTWFWLLLWALAGWGLVRMARGGHGILAILLAAMAVSGWLGYPVFIKRHWFTGRYVFVGTLTLAVGLSWLAAGFWSLKSKTFWLPRAAVLVMAGALVYFWLPVWRSVYADARTQVRQTFEPLIQQARQEDLLLVVPDWHIAFRHFYSLGPAQLVRPPSGARYNVLEADRDPAGSIKPYAIDFQALAQAVKRDGQPLPRLWLVWFFDRNDEPTIRQRLAECQPVFELYGIADARAIESLKRVAEQPRLHTMTLLLADGKIQWMSSTIGRSRD